jgi:hypothetical protein
MIPQASASVLDLVSKHNNNADDDGVTHLLSVDKREEISHRSHHQLLLLLDTGEILKTYCVEIFIWKEPTG